jgi:Ni,Fe-hydrogenase III small subunit
MVGNLASAVNPPEDHSGYGGTGCSCHNFGVGIWVNSTDFYATEEVFYANVESGKSFSLLINTVGTATTTEGLLQPAVAWMPDMTDNAKFKFDPQEVKDNAPQDQDPSPGIMGVLFRITAPNQTGSYIISLSTQGSIVSVLVTVRGASPSGFASVTNVQSPSAVRAGASVGMDVTLWNKGLAPYRLYVYATDHATGQVVFAKVYSESPIPANGTATLSGAFNMPNGNLTLMIRSGHVEGDRDVDDDLFSFSILQPQSLPPVQTAQFGVLAMQWAPWIAVVAATLGSVPLVGMYARRGKRLLPKGEKLKLAVVECAGCSVCKNAIKSLGEGALKLASHQVNLTSNLKTSMEDGHVDVALVLGSIRTEKDIEAVKEAREKAKVLVAFGACSAFGELAAGDRRRVDAIARGLREPVIQEALHQRTIKTKPLSDYVKVDLTIPGCPPPLEAIRYAIDAAQYGSSSGERNN